MKLWSILLIFVVVTLSSLPQDNVKLKHPLPDYSSFSDVEISAMAAQVRKSNPQMHRGGWEWDRLLARYVDGHRQEAGALKILQGYFMSILDRYDNIVKEGRGDEFNLLSGHKAWGAGGRMRIYEELVHYEMLTAHQREKFRMIVSQSLARSYDYPMLERGVNNRPYGMNGGPAVALRLFPNMPNLKKHRRWLDALWRELIEYGDTTETNYYPYGPLLLQGLLDMANGMDKFKANRELLYALAKRYLDYVHGGGVRGNPNSGARVIGDRKKIYVDPWNAEYYAGAEGVNDGDVWYRLAKEFRDPEFLWASEQVLLGGRPPCAQAPPPEYLEAYNCRYAWFVKQGIQPEVPTGRSKIGYYSPLKYKVPERIYLGPGRESGKPFVSFYVYDRNNNYMHCCDDAAGRLYEYCVDGAKLLHSSGKYNNRFLGQVGYDLLSILPPDMAFPVQPNGEMGGESEDTWKMASLSLPFCLNCRTAPDSKNWLFDDSIGKFRRTDDPDFGFAYGNMDGYWYLNNQFHLNSIQLGKFDKPTAIQNLRLAGPKGKVILAALNTVPENLKVFHQRKGEESRELTGDERKRAFSLINEGRHGGKSLRLNVPPGVCLSLVYERLNLDFDANNEYTRVSFDYKGSGQGLMLNDRIRPRYHRPTYNRGGVLVRDSLRAENQGDDSFGQFTYRNYFGAHSKWTRQTVLTAEGHLIVRDEYLPGLDVDGFQAAPCWLLRGEGEAETASRNWYDAPAMDHAWWQTQKKRVLLYMHPGDCLAFGQVEHNASQDIGGKIHSTFAKAILKAGKPQIWLSVLQPFNEGTDPKTIVARINTKVDSKGSTEAEMRGMKISIQADGTWSVNRH